MVRARTGEWISKGWNMVISGRNFWMFVLLALIWYAFALIGQALVNIIAIPFEVLTHTQYHPQPHQSFEEMLRLMVPSIILKVILGMLISTPITFVGMAAAYAVILNLLRTGRFDLDRIQDIFPHIVQLLLVGLVVGIFKTIGGLLCIIPGVIVSIFYIFPILLIIDQKLSFWDAMEESRRKTQQDFWGFFLFLLVIGGVNILGVLACCVGSFISEPVTWCAMAIAYRELWPEPQPATLITPAPEA